jgi:hypothetical protein
MKAMFTCLALLAMPAHADAPEIKDVTARQTGTSWSFSVTLSHPDTGWDHYADGWEVLALDGTRLGVRELLHPHVNEQPFTRSQSGIQIPDDMDKVLVRARDSVDGWAEGTVEFTLPK